QENAEVAVRNMLRDFAVKHDGCVRASDHMDDGTPICLEVSIDKTTSSAVFDFTGTGPQVFGNTNAPPAVVHSAIIYSLRAMLDKDIPLNHGCMKAVTIVIPEGSLLDPSPDAAVVGGNVLTSQRVTDVILSAFNAAAPSQGCMNNLTFGDDNMGYYGTDLPSLLAPRPSLLAPFRRIPTCSCALVLVRPAPLAARITSFARSTETIAGGAGAGPGWNGRSGVHTHMTNTRITDPEILERRYPVAVKSFSLRAGSGGPGRWSGGDGVVRELEFLRPLTVSILSERRCTDVPGLLGGAEGARGRNLLIKLDQTGRGTKTISLGGKATVDVAAGDRLRIESPGGGGYGAVEGSEVEARHAAAGDAATVAWMCERHRQVRRADDGKDDLKTGSVREFERKQVEA
ncbi:MAG: hydantoinase B/oxoprolinase family protein, partial [bacterium]